ncbi:YbfB/YjiJ family MFS transporter [Venatoribacter cucullus]|uniref:YbfB/YjiJ family MFS transporter n=1 Tax=Venatoribacter cucullus TaxID=2661630 RepID=A0A9X7UYN0_9GAMM|nr:YbfB/YjiJ family MFS transporter [Venatoribacter cucullus]QQD25368.1 YbfB/YjiJ family MFS transporter [Venatoribacter cucullus]
MHANTPPSSYWWPIVAAATALIVVHGFGRFVYTPLLPLLVDDGLISLPQAASLATWNYIGYLTGAMLALFLYQRGFGRQALLSMLVGNALITLIQVWATYYPLLAGLRLLNGIGNGVVFVLAPALVLEWLVTQSKAHHSGLMYLGVGVGILGSSLLVDLTYPWLQGATRWIPAAAVALPLALWSAWYLGRLPGHGPVTGTPKDDHSALWDRASTPLFLAYAGAGLGYILPMTFLPAVAADWNIKMVPSAWLLVALASLPSTWLWNHLGARIGDKAALLWNYAIQAISILLLLTLEHKSGLFLSALLMGGSFLGAVLLTQRLARTLHPHQGPRLSAALIALYGFTQLTGPWLAKLGIESGATLSSTFIWGFGALVWAFVLMLWVPVKVPSPKT